MHERKRSVESGRRQILIVNADDFGQSAGVNRGIIEAFEHGIVTSTSLMVHWPAAAQAARYARANPALAVGLHLDFGEWVMRSGEWVELYAANLTDPDAVRDEVRRQLDLFRKLVGADPTHLDSHQHVHQREPIRAAALEIACELNIHLRHFSAGIRYCGDFYGQDEHGGPYHRAIEPGGLISALRQLQPGITELACHPGYADDLDTMYSAERALEIRTLCDPMIRRVIDDFGIRLKSFRDWACNLTRASDC
jgi:predicted glycoside hydrolase/deacetylase ChbG (UPF0249 family)